MAIEIPIVWTIGIKDTSAPTTTVAVGDIITGFSDLHSYERNMLEFKPVTTDVNKKYPGSYALNDLTLTIKAYSIATLKKLLVPDVVELYFENNGIVDPTGTYITIGYKVIGYVSGSAMNFDSELQGTIKVTPNTSVFYNKAAGVTEVIQSLPGSGVAAPALPAPF